MSRENVKRVRRSPDAWNRGDVGAWLQSGHPEIEIHDLGDTVLVLARVRTRGEARGIKLARPVAYVFEFEEGLARKVRAYLDPGQALEAVGLPG